MPEKLTVLIPVKNERLNIRPCIESVRPIADEIFRRQEESEEDDAERPTLPEKS